ncbi:MAG TPA: protein translocase subunit SecF [Vicinamibacterales bacterium]|jgi:preprotein translocase subunit SecF|nr:protein translocase subunit SecF [Vicinamibacterales bacterium]
MRIFAHANYNFIKWRWHALIVSLVLIWAGVAHVIWLGGLPLGIDFSGGTVVVLQFDHPTSVQAVRDGLGPAGQDAVVQSYGDASRHQVMVRLPETGGEGANLDELAGRIQQSIQAANIGTFTVVSRQMVGPAVGHDLQQRGIWATLTALGGILIYVAFRFRLTFAIGAIVATFHDILITLVFLTWFHYDLSLNIIAAILTIAGYSVNDTIVVFDRVREDQRLMRRAPLDEIVNAAVNQTLGRTIITSGTTFLAVLALYLFGGEVLRGFAFTMLIGIITGTYSTVFIAASIAIILSRRNRPVAAAAATTPARTTDVKRRRRA